MLSKQLLQNWHLFITTDLSFKKFCCPHKRKEFEKEKIVENQKQQKLLKNLYCYYPQKIVLISQKLLNSPTQFSAWKLLVTKSKKNLKNFKNFKSFHVGKIIWKLQELMISRSSKSFLWVKKINLLTPLRALENFLAHSIGNKGKTWKNNENCFDSKSKVGMHEQQNKTNWISIIGHFA